VAASTSDPKLTPQSDNEREAVRKVLEYMRTKKGVSAPAPSADTARITVRLPAEARLYIDGNLVPLTSDTRTFSTPALERGRRYFYTMRMEIDRDGQPASESRRVIVAAGERVDVNFNTPATATAQR
jgi:uncharacterized protein (TIGR03000 family)